jgi:single-strand DNA-binding protein
MSRGVNRVILVGYCGQDPELKIMSSGSSVAHVSIATSESWTDKQSGQKQERTEWHRVAFFNRLAEVVGEYIKKGSKIYVEGSLRTNKWQDKKGNDRYTTEIVAREMQMLDGKSESGQSQPAPPPVEGDAQARVAPKAAESFENFDDDIPF